MNDIPSIKDAQAALETLQHFLDGMSKIFAVNQSVADRANGTQPAQRTRRTRPAKKTKPTWKGKVASILDDAGRPMTPAEITDKFNELYDWKETRGKLGNRIRSTLAFMKGEGLVLAQDGKYRLGKQQELM